jgi:hypothetical protein
MCPPFIRKIRKKKDCFLFVREIIRRWFYPLTVYGNNRKNIIREDIVPRFFMWWKNMVTYREERKREIFSLSVRDVF